MNLELFIAKRLFGTRKKGERISKPAVTIALWGVAVGIIIMIVSMCIVVGFKQEIRNKIVGFGSHIQIRNYETCTDGEYPVTTLPEDIDNIRGINGVKHVQQYIQKPGLIAIDDEFEGIILKGIGEEYDKSFFTEHIVEGNIPIFSDSVASNSIILSRSMAKRMRVNVGDKINIYFMQKGIKARRMTLAAIYETHLTEMDAILGITDIYTMRKLNGWSYDKSTGIEIAVNNFDETENIRDIVTERMTETANRNEEQLYIQTVMEMNPHMFAWLDVLDSTVWIILVIVLGIAGFTTISGLLILILEKTSLIGILKAIGAKNISIRKVFLYYAMFIIGRGMMWGNIIGLTICIIQKETGIIELNPEMYYMQYVPIEFTWWLIPMNIGMFIISVLMLVLPSMLIAKIEPTKAIKFE